MMKKSMLVLLMLLGAATAQTQSTPDENGKREHRFYAGITYSYVDFEMKLKDISFHSVWQGVDFGTFSLSPGEIDTINEHTERNASVQGILLEGGMKIFENPESKWRLEGSFMAGLGMSSAETFNKSVERKDMEMKTGFSQPCLGIGLNLAYRLSEHWELFLEPSLSATFGKTDDITDYIYPVSENFTETREDKYSMLYHRINLMATFKAGHFAISAGPGFCYVWSRHDYTIERINNTEGYILYDEIITKMVPRTYFDGVLSLNWDFLDPFSLNLTAGLGKDLHARGGLFIHF